MKPTIIAVLIVMASLFTSNVAMGEVKTFTKEYSYQASELDSKVTSRINAMEQVKRLLLEELGVLVMSETIVENSALTKDQITSFTGGIVSTEVLEEKWNGHDYWIKARLVADSSIVSITLQAILKDKNKQKDLENARQQIARLTVELESVKKGVGSGTPQDRQKRYTQIVNQMRAFDWLMRAYATYDKTKPYAENTESIDALNKAIEVDPDFYVAFVMRAAFKLEYLKDNKGAIDDITKSIAAFKPDTAELSDLFKTKAPLYGIRAKFHYMASNYKNTIEDLFNAMEIDPEHNPEWSDWNKGELDILVKKYPSDWRTYVFRAIQNNNFVKLSADKNGIALKKMLSDIKKAEKLKPNSPYVDLAFVNYYKMQSYIFRLRNANPSNELEENLIKSLTKLLSHKPTTPLKYMSYRLRASILIDKKEFDKAIDDCNNALRIQSNYGGTYFDRAQAYRGKKLYDMAIADYNQALNSKEKSAVRDYNIYATIGDTYVEKNDLENAKIYFTKSIQWEINERADFKNKYGVDTDIVPQNILAEIYEKRADVYLQLKEYDKSLADYNKAIELIPEHSYTSHLGRSTLYAITGKFDDAISDVNFVIELDKKYNTDPTQNYWALHKLYIFKYNNAKHPKFIELYNSILSFGPDYNAYISRADYYDMMGINDEAFEDYTKAIQIKPTSSLYTSRGATLGKLGNFKQAISDLNKAIKMNPTEADAYYLRAVCNNNLDKPLNLPINDFKIAAKLGHEEAQKLLSETGQSW